MRKLNVKLFLYFLGGLVLLSGTLFASHQLQAGNISSGLLYQANQAEKEGRLKQATRYLTRYLDFVPDDTEVRARLGKTLADPRLASNSRTRGKARFVLEQVLAREPDRHDVRRTLVRLALDAQQFDLVEEHLKYLQNALPNDGEVAGLVGRWQEFKGQDADALAKMRASVQNAPDAVDNLVRLVNLLRKADGGKHGQPFKEAEAHLAAALVKSPDDAGVLLAAADLALDRGDLREAGIHLERALKLHADQGRVHVALARYELRRNKRPDAIAGLKRGLQAARDEDRYELRWTLANLLIDAGELDEARTVTAKLQDENPSPGTMDFLQARVLVLKGQWFEASRLLEQVRPMFKALASLTLQVDLMLAACYERLEEPERQLAACQRVIALDPASVIGRQGIATAQWALGQHDEAIEQYREIVKLNVAAKAATTGRVELARMLLLRALQAEKHDWRPVAEELDAAEKEQPGAAEVVLLRAEMLNAQKKVDDAKALLLEALKSQPKRVEFWAGLAGLAERGGEPEKALALLDEAQNAAGDSVELRLARARYWGGRPKAEAVPALRRLEKGLVSFPADRQAALLTGLAQAADRTGDLDEAARLYAELAKQPRHRRDVRLRMLLFDLAVQRKDDAAMQKALEDIRALEEGESALYLFGQASRQLFLARQGNKGALDEARSLLDRVVKLRPAWPAVLLAKAELEQLQGNAEQAIANYRRAVEAGVRSPSVVRQLVELLTSRQRYDEAEEELRKLQKLAPLSPSLQRVWGALEIQKNGFGRAEQVVRDTVSEKSTDYRDHLWTGQMLSQGGRRSTAAEKAFRRAVELGEGVPETWMALVHYLADTGRGKVAAAEIEKARAKMQGPDAALALAQGYEAIGRMDRARAEYQAALKARPQEIGVRRSYVAFCLRNGTPRDAEPHLRDVVERKLPASEADVAWARRGLALTLSSTASHKHFAEALALAGLTLDGQGNPVEGAAPAGGWPVEDQVVRARVLATQTRRPLRAKAVALLEELQKRQALAADDQLLLARLYQAMGPEDIWWARAREQMQTLVGTYSRNPGYLLSYAQSLLQHGEILEAERAIAKLEAAEKNLGTSLGSSELKARALELRGKKTEALAVLKVYAEAPKAPPERVLLYAGLQGRLGRLTEAIDTCETALKKCAPSAVGGAAVAVLRAARPAAGQPEDVWRAQAARVEAWLKEAAKKDDASPGPRLQLADLMDLVGRSGESEPLYRQVLEHDPRNQVALNNLSWLLAQQKDRAAEALTVVEKAIEIHGPRAELLDTRAVAYLALGQTEKALADLEQAVADAPTPAKYFHLTRAHHQASNRQAARAALTRATAAGLTAERLHPAERDAFRQLVADLKN